jgi:ABC-type branched-subunit amino acid transport system substrate-binding protein
MKKYLGLAVVVAVVIGVILVGKSSNDVAQDTLPQSEQPKPIKVGVIAPLSGIVAFYGEEAKRGIEAAEKTDIEIIYEDDQCDPKVAVAAFKKLTELDQVNVIIGPLCGSSQEALTGLAKDKDVTLLLPAAASDRLFELSGGAMYNTQYSLEKESTFNAEEITKLGHSKVALITYPNAFSKVHEEAFKQAFTGTIVTTITLPAEETVPLTEMIKLARENFDAIYVTDISFYFGGGMEKLAQANITVPLFSTYVVELPMVRSLVGNTIYSFPEDMTAGDGGVFGLAKEAVELVSDLGLPCAGSNECLRQKLTESGKFDSKGVRQREIILKQIQNDVAVPYKNNAEII